MKFKVQDFLYNRLMVSFWFKFVLYALKIVKINTISVFKAFLINSQYHRTINLIFNIMKNLKMYLTSFIVILGSLTPISCDNNESDSMATSRITIKMSDAPGDYKEVNVDVRDVMIKSNTNTDDQGWASIGNLPSQGKVYNLLSLTGGINAVLADKEVTPGYVGQIRLLLGDQNTVVLKDGTSYPLKTPSAQQSGLKIQVNQTLTAGVTYDYLLDFDVNKSIVVQAGSSGIYNLNPVIRVTTSATSGVIKGSVENIATAKQVMVSVQVGTETVSTFTDAQGMFQLNGVPAGTYIVTFTPDTTSGLLVKTVPGIIVVNGQVTTMTAIAL